MNYATASDGTILIETQSPGVLRQIYFSGHHSDSERFAVSVNTFVQGESTEISHSYTFDKRGMLLRAQRRYGTKFIWDETPGFSQTVDRSIALLEYSWIRDAIQKIVQATKAKVKPEFQKTIDDVCCGDFAQR